MSALPFSALAQGDEPLRHCFDFSRPLEHRFNEPKTWVQTEPDSRGIRENSGDLPGKAGVWAAVERSIARPIAEVIAELLSHEVTKAGQASEMKISKVGGAQGKRELARQRVHFVVKPFPLISVEWTEEWLFTLLQGTPSSPEHAMVGYEKVDGTSHIEHLCGFYELTGEPGNRTRVYLYEEAKATGRTEWDTLVGIRTTVDKLQAKTAP